MEKDNIIFLSGTEQYQILGLSRKEIRASISLPYQEFQKSSFSKNTTDSYEWFHVFYDENDNCEAIEFFNKYPLCLENQAVMGLGRNQIKRMLLKIDADILEDEYGIVSEKLSIGISCPNKKVEGVLIGVQGYYTD